MLVVVQHQVPMFLDDVAQEAEKNRDMDGADKAKIDAKNHLENYCITARNTHTEVKPEGELEAGHKKKFVQGCFGLEGQESIGREERVRSWRHGDNCAGCFGPGGHISFGRES